MEVLYYRQREHVGDIVVDKEERNVVPLAITIIEIIYYNRNSAIVPM